MEQTEWNFGRVVRTETVSATVTLKNAGDEILRLEPPIVSCNCTTANLDPETLAPGKTGELRFTLTFGRFKAHYEEHITLKSNDPKTPEVLLTLKADYVPLYDITPTLLSPTISLGAIDTNRFVLINRTDDKEIGTLQFLPSKPWIRPKPDFTVTSHNSSMKVGFEIEPDGPPRPFYEYVLVCLGGKTNDPVGMISVYGRVGPELSATPETLSWTVPARTAVKDLDDSLLTRRATIRLGNGKEFKLKNPSVTLKEIAVELIPNKSGTAYDLVAKIVEVPDRPVSGYVSLETSVASQPKLEVNVLIKRGAR